MTAPKHFLDLSGVKSEDLFEIMQSSRALKSARAGQPKGVRDQGTPLAGHVLVMIFEKPSTRTRVSFDVAMRQLGGEALMLSAADLQLGRGETIADTAQVLSRYADAIMIRSTNHDNLMELAKHATVPVINGLTDLSHPCQIVADLLTMEEHKGAIKDQTVVWCGDGNNVASSWIHAAGHYDFDLRLACPEQLPPSQDALDWAAAHGAKISVTTDPDEAVDGADVVVTDVWASMGASDNESRHNLLRPYQVDARLMAKAKPDAVFMHCLPARRGEEMTAEVIDGPQSVVFDEAENRLHAQKGILAWCLGASQGR
ncbi:MAG: ornithine carbamoyltransferase [Pseudomonadota bacterium]